jgi:hypothetical protein
MGTRPHPYFAINFKRVHEAPVPLIVGINPAMMDHTIESDVIHLFNSEYHRADG